MTKTQQFREQGFASITVALVLVLVLGLITVGFAQLARREQNNTLDNHLSRQALDVADSAINQIRGQLDANPSTYDSVVDGNTCLDTSLPSTPKLTGTSDPDATGASYGCIMVNVKPKATQYTNLPAGEGVNTSFETDTAPTEITFSWGPMNADHNTFKSQAERQAGVFPQVGAWGNAPAIVQLSITPLSSLKRADLVNNTFNVFLYPSKNDAANSIAFSTAAADQGKIISGNCEAGKTYMCSSVVSDLPGATSYLVHFIPFYDGATQASFTASNLELKKSQAIIDVTGKARDVLKRERAVIDISRRGGSTNVLPDYALEVDSACKRQETRPGTTTYNNPFTAPAGKSCDPAN